MFHNKYHKFVSKVHRVIELYFFSLCVVECSVHRIALIFRRFKFSRRATLKEFVEQISQICVAHVCLQWLKF